MNDSATLQWTTDSLALATGVSAAFAVLALVVAGHVAAGRSRWLRLATMGVLETGYCALMIPFMRAPGQEESLFWIQLISVFMPAMTWLFVELTIEIADLRQHWMRHFSRVTAVLTLAFSTVLVADMSTGSRLIFTTVSLDPGTLHLKMAQATLLAKAYLGFVNVAFYVSAFYLVRHWCRVDRSLGPLIAGCFLYFLSITNDFNILFHLYDFAFLQHFGFLALYVGFSLHHGLEQVRVSNELRVAADEVKRHRAEMIENEKLRALGMASAFVTHEMNNALTLLTMATAMQSRRGDSATRDSEQLSDIDLAVRQLTELVQSLQTFSRDARDDAPELVAVKRVVSEATRIARARAKSKGVELQVEVHEGLTVSGRPARLVQALLNLLNNGCDAAEGTDPAWVRIEARRNGDNRVEIAVLDSGAGVPREARAHLLEPFFTTKPAGAGTGLGLAVVKDIATRHGGSLDLDLESEHTRFVLTLPAC